MRPAYVYMLVYYEAHELYVEAARRDLYNEICLVVLLCCCVVVLLCCKVKTYC